MLKSYRRHDDLSSAGIAIAAAAFSAVLLAGGWRDATAQQSAETSASATLEEVVVTARARVEEAADVPISIQSFSAAQLAADQITDLNALQYQAGFTYNSQGMSTQGGGREFPTLVFRGLSTNFGYGFNDSGALFVDGIFVSGGTASVTMADVSRVEVLKGPQNVYFGKNTFGGAINLITANPSEDFHGYANVGYSTKGSFDDTFSVEGALVPNLLTARVTAEAFHQGKQYTSFDGGALGEQDTKGVTAVLYFTPTSNMWIRTRFHYSHDDDSAADTGFLSGISFGANCAGFVNKYFCNGIPSLARTGTSVLDYAHIPAGFASAVASNAFGFAPPLAHDPLLTQVPTKDTSGLIRDNLQGSLASGVTLPNQATIEFTTGWSQSQSSDIADGDHTSTPFFLTDQPIINHDFQADLRYVSSADQPLRFIGGVSFFQSLYRTLYDGYYLGGSFANSGVVNEFDETKAVYGSLEYDFTSFLTATAEVRYQRDTVSDRPYEGLGTTEEVAENFDHALPRVSLRYHPNKDTNVYASYAEGIQPPYLQASYINGNSYTRSALAAITAGAGDYTQDPTLWVWEFGLKQAAFDNRLNFNIDYYTEIWNNALVSNYVHNPVGCPTIGNFGTSTLCPYPSAGAAYYGVSRDHIQGVEFEGSALVTPKWTVHAAFNYTHAIRESYADQGFAAAFTSGVAPDLSGKYVDLVPNYQGSLDSTYKDHLVADWSWYVHGLVTFTGSVYADELDTAKTNAYARVNASIGVVKGPLTVELYGTNLFNDKNWDMAVRYPDASHGNIFFSETQQGVLVSAPNPLNVGIRVSGKF
jgi:iron complex outermembrane receptor protein